MEVDFKALDYGEVLNLRGHEHFVGHVLHFMSLLPRPFFQAVIAFIDLRLGNVSESELETLVWSVRM